MSGPRSLHTPLSAFKRLKTSSSSSIILQTQHSHLHSSSSHQKGSAPHGHIQDNAPTVKDSIKDELVRLANERQIPLPPVLQPRPKISELRQPRSVQALYLTPLRRTSTHGIPVANLQLRSYSIRNLEYVADFALRSAYYLGLAAKGPVPLPRITERWTVPRSVFVHKKSQENFERITVRRLIQILDGHPEVVQHWLAFVRKWQWYGVGMRADVWEHESLGVGERMDQQGEEVMEKGLSGSRWDLVVRRAGDENTEKEGIRRMLKKQGLEGPEAPPGLPQTDLEKLVGAPTEEFAKV